MILNTDTSSIKTEDFVRYEFKFPLDLRKREEVELEVANFMSFDGHVHPELHNAYYVRSLYYENDSATHYYEKIDGVKERRKFRLRTYGKEFISSLPIYLEEKNRDGDRVRKHRIPIDPSHLPAFCSPERYTELHEVFSGVDLVGRFLFDAFRRSLKPKLLVDYVRRPYVSAYDMNFRVTFDSVLMSAKTDSLFPPVGENWMHSFAGFTILEVKFHRRIPAWFHRIIQAHNLRRVSFSKFCKGMEATNQAVDLQ
jgi:SPX domain protein involved in polyphosphate accumulation